MLFVRKSNYHQKKQTIQQLESQNQQLQEQISQLQTLQEENPTSARSLTIKNLSKKQGNVYSRLNGLGAEIKDGVEREREREREQNRQNCRTSGTKELPRPGNLNI